VPANGGVQYAVGRVLIDLEMLEEAETVLEAAQALASNGVQEAQVRSIVQGLVDDGEMYSTIDDDHFKTIDDHHFKGIPHAPKWSFWNCNKSDDAQPVRNDDDRVC
jgi:hypothetical protein